MPQKKTAEKKTTEKRMAGLLAALRREGGEDSPQTTHSTEFTQTKQSSPSKQQKPSPPKAKRGAAVQFWLRDEDRQTIRELSAYLATQGHRPTDSLVVRAALRLVRADASLISAFQQAQALDGRRR